MRLGIIELLRGACIIKLLADPKTIENERLCRALGSEQREICNPEVARQSLFEQTEEPPDRKLQGYIGC